MEKQVSVSVSIGVVTSLISKLDLLIQAPRPKSNEKEAESSKEEVTGLPKLKTSEKKVVESFKGELVTMSAVLMAGDQAESAAASRTATTMAAPDIQVKAWMKQVREITYDAEDFVDLFLRQPAGRKQPRSFLRRWDEALGRSGHGFAEQIQQFKARLVEANERRERYKIDVPPSDEASRTTADLRPNDAAIDPDLMLVQRAAPVGIDGPTEQLRQILAVGEDEDKQHAKVISVLGLAGVGKTTLALHVYQMLRESFDCGAFVYVGRRPSVAAVLVDIISQVTPHSKGDDIENDDEHIAMGKLRDILQNKRYLIVIDDIWSISSWKGISCALPHNDGSRIIVTTRSHDIARSCSHRSDLIYEMPALALSDSKRLFHSRVSGSAQEECSNKCSDVHDSILKFCGGLPSSILIVASLLARTAKPEEWEKIHESTLSKIEQYPPLERLNKILHLGYTSLPFPAKSCFLYLSVFPKNFEVKRDRLIWRWIAEGFIPGNLLETGTSYFNELINRSLIQPVFADDDEDPVACKVQGAVHDFIVSLSSAENFVTLDEELASTPRDTVRRLSLNYIKQQEPGTKLERRDSGHMNLSQARSLTVLGRAQQMLPHLASFQLLRVLDLEDAGGVAEKENRNLEDIGRLFNLVYLGLAGHSITELPRTIRELQHLETLDVIRTEVQELPEGGSSASGLQKMVRLLAKTLDGSKLQAEVLEKMQGLQELSTVGVNSDSSLKFIAELFSLKQLRILGVKWCFSNDDVKPNDLGGYRKEFITCLNKVSKSNIISLSIQSDQGCSLGFLADSKVVPWTPPYKLQKLVMTSSSSYFDKIPAKLEECSFLTYLEITVAINLDGGEEDLRIIANLPSLTILKLSASGNPITIAQGFRCLKVFSFQRRERSCDLGLVFQAGAMPSLRKLCLNFKVPSSDHHLRQLEEQHGIIVSGLEHLPSLMQVNVKMERHGAGEASSVEKAIKKHIRVDGKSFKLELSWEKARPERELKELLVAAEA